MAVVAIAMMAVVVACTSTSTTPDASSASTLPAVRLSELDGGDHAKGKTDEEEDDDDEGDPADVEADFDLAQYRGTPIILNVWATWCTPCRTEMPVLQAAQDRFDGKLQIIGVTDDLNREAAIDAASQAGVSYPLLVDDDGRLQSDLGITGLPATVFLDGSGQILELHAGALDAAGLDQLIGTHYGLT